MDIKAKFLAIPPINLSSNITDALSGGQAAASVMVISTIQDAGQKLAVKDAFVWSMRNMFIFSTCVAALAVVASLFIKKSFLSKVHVETKTGLKEKAEVAVVSEQGAIV
jgi:hypothetical protein